MLPKRDPHKRLKQFAGGLLIFLSFALIPIGAALVAETNINGLLLLSAICGGLGLGGTVLMVGRLE